MLDRLKSALAVFIMFVGLTIAVVIGIGFAMTCFAIATRAEVLPLPDTASSEAVRDSLPPLHTARLTPSKTRATAGISNSVFRNPTTEGRL